MPLSEHMYCVTVTFKMTEQVEQQICIKFYVKLEHCSTETIQIQKATALGNRWLAASSQQCACSCIMSCAEVFGETSNHPGDSAQIQPRFGTLRLLAFPKPKITFERGEISDHWWDSGKCNRAADGDSNRILQSVLNSGIDTGRTVWGPKVPTLKETEASLSYV